ncbi:Pygopus-like 2 [Mizuhopecten yessoensis]|uniref:Pygopus-like 2 n=1 Tax=Mizuhopecten yessoensis TaxID=6573 RepID=A0A210QDL3_MIZYE|nr:Pygopus-like 2 [Mizuhopecten yessoensis]
MGRGKKWPCGSCHKDTHNTQSLLCESCDKWFHSDCESIGKSKFDSFTRSSEPYICHLCRTDDGIFDYLHGTARLKMVSLYALI